VVDRKNETQFLKLTEANTEADMAIKAEKLQVVKSPQDRKVNKLHQLPLTSETHLLELWNYGVW
jgi:hypothetical protein